ncbi:YSC84-related protein [Desulfospira joergensenii]|uniref:lipid-binding SYLF domain-containing protein n=1 Tax=Desulfospira joergensenii TaxID=53329 RepID=UPI0003B4F3C5|nr:lipid-binding SYLF domain-containing protein [Desulfospira joergensenii]
MKRFLSGLLLMMILLATSVFSPAFADEYTHTLSIFKNSPAVQPFFKDAYGYTIFPTIGKAGFVVGGAFGKGQVYKHGALTGTVTLSRVSVGFQIGGQAFSEMIFFQDKRAYDEFTSGTFEFDASASAVAITAGAQAKAGTEGATAGASAGPATGVQAETHYRKGMAIFVHTKGGLMAEFSVGGQKFEFSSL